MPESASCNGITAEMEDLILHLSTSVNSSQIAEWTASDLNLSQVKHYVLTGWPSKLPGKEFSPERMSLRHLMDVSSFAHKLLFHHKDNSQCLQNSMKLTQESLE